MLNLRKVAITGGLASGKTTVCQILSDLGACVISADSIAHKLLTPETELGQKVIQLFGRSILVDEKIDRNRVANQAFNNPGKLRVLESLLHPPVYDEIQRLYLHADESGKYPLFVAEVPLLFESGGEEFFDTTIAVFCPTMQSAERFSEKTGFEREEYDRRMAFQLTPEKKMEKADFVIENIETFENLKKQTTALFNQLAEKKS